MVTISADLSSDVDGVPVVSSSAVLVGTAEVLLLTVDSSGVLVVVLSAVVLGEVLGVVVVLVDVLGGVVVVVVETVVLSVVVEVLSVVTSGAPQALFSIITSSIAISPYG